MNLPQGENCLIIAGEKSGEEHCLSFFSELKEGNPNCKFWGVGGDQLEKEGMELMYHLKDFSSWGFSEVIGKVPFYIKAFNKIVKEVEKRNCKYAILIDFQDFNLRLAKKLKSKGVEVFYYVAPQAWAWKAGRAAVLERTVHTLFTIIPFEKKWFQDRGVKRVKSVPHPLWVTYNKQLLDLPENKTFEQFNEQANLLILPGSRNFEVENLLPDFMDAAQIIKKEHNIKVSIVKSSNVKEEHFEKYLSLFDKIYSNEELPIALKDADFCLAASGTVTLATALFQVPTVVSYKTSKLNKFVFDNFINYEGYISLANIVHEKELFPEVLQAEVTGENLIKKVAPLFLDGNYYSEKVQTLKKTKDILQGEEMNVAKYISEEMNKNENK